MKIETPIAVVVDAIITGQPQLPLRKIGLRSATGIHRKVDENISVIIAAVRTLRIFDVLQSVGATRIVGKVDQPIAVVIDPVRTLHGQGGRGGEKKYDRGGAA
jgi:hypothetical protein